jgi:hypothetical protein
VENTVAVCLEKIFSYSVGGKTKTGHMVVCMLVIPTTFTGGPQTESFRLVLG